MNKKRIFKKFTRDAILFKQVRNSITEGDIVVDSSGLQLHWRQPEKRQK